MVIEIGLVKNLLNLLPHASVETQEPVTKSLHLITTAGDSCIEAVTQCNGLEVIKNMMPRTGGSLQKLACRAISNIIAGNVARIDIAIDCGVVPYLVEIFSSKTNTNRKHALWAVYQMIKGGNPTQVKRIVEQDCVTELCDLIRTDSKCTIIAIWAAKKILEVGENQLILSPTTSTWMSTFIQTTKSKLDELSKENTRLVEAKGFLDLLKKKEAWVKFDVQKNQVDLSKKAISLLKNEQHIAQQRISSFETHIAKVGTESTLGKVHCALHKKEKERKAFLDDRLRNITLSLEKENEVLKQLLEGAMSIAPKAEFEALLAQDHLPKDLEGVKTALEKYAFCIEFIKEKKTGVQRKVIINAISEGLRKMFKAFDDASKSSCDATRLAQGIVKKGSVCNGSSYRFDWRCFDFQVGLCFNALPHNVSFLRGPLDAEYTLKERKKPDRRKRFEEAESEDEEEEEHPDVCSSRKSITKKVQATLTDYYRRNTSK
ncbi:hypothetical protein ACHAWF_017813 [Thalassiosira exigua]